MGARRPQEREFPLVFALEHILQASTEMQAAVCALACVDAEHDCTMGLLQRSPHGSRELTPAEVSGRDHLVNKEAAQLDRTAKRPFKGAQLSYLTWRPRPT